MSPYFISISLSVVFLLIVYHLNETKSLIYRLYNWNRPVYFVLKTIVTLLFLFTMDSLRKNI